MVRREMKIMGALDCNHFGHRSGQKNIVATKFGEKIANLAICLRRSPTFPIFPATKTSFFFGGLFYDFRSRNSDFEKEIADHEKANTRKHTVQN